MTRGESLYQLQNVDLELKNGERRISEIRANLGETPTLRRARQELTAAQEEQRKWATRVRDLELEIESLNNKIATSEERLYSGQVTNPKELSDRQDEIASLKRRRSTLEDELLEAMVQDEEAEATLENRREQLSEIESQWQANQRQLKQELEELEMHLAKARQERDKLRRIISSKELALYDNIRERYGPVAVVTLRDGVCGYCAVAPSSTKLKNIRTGRELLECSNCKRILLDL